MAKSKTKKANKQQSSMYVWAMVAFVFIFVLLSSLKLLSSRSNSISSNVDVTATPALQQVKSCAPDECIINEFGVKFKTPEGLQDLVYTVSDRAVRFSTRSLMEIESYCTPKESSLGSLDKVMKPETSGRDWKKLTSGWYDDYSGHMVSPVAKEFNNFYLLYEGPQASCSTTNEGQQLEISQVQLMKKIPIDLELIQ